MTKNDFHAAFLVMLLIVACINNQDIVQIISIVLHTLLP
jgi:hypothetical protein